MVRNQIVISHYFFAERLDFIEKRDYDSEEVVKSGVNDHKSGAKWIS